ncbi:MAG: GNAT family N-acetyltransferase [Myxococcaceae bacterium]
MLLDLQPSPSVDEIARVDLIGSSVEPSRSLAELARVDLITSLGELAAMRTEWNALHDASAAGAFLSWEWIYPWCRRIGADWRLFLLAARDRQGALLGLLPLGVEKSRGARRLAFLAATHVGSDDLDQIAVRGLDRELARRFAHELHLRRGGWDLLDLTDLREDSVLLEALREKFLDEGDVVLNRERYLCPFETFAPGETFDAFLHRTARRDNYLRRKKWLEKQPGYRIEKTDVPQELARPLAEFFWLHSLRWADDGGSQGIKGPGVEAFHREATHLLAERGQLRLYTLRMGDAAVASVYGIFQGDRFLYFQSGYDPAWRNKSVGLVLVGETFKDAIERGCRGYEFLRGTESYKADWASQVRKTAAIRIHSARGPGAWWTRTEAAARWSRELAKRALPTGAVEKIRRLRRRWAAV